MTVGGRRKERLDRILVDRGLATTRTQAQALILAGRVHSADRLLRKPGERYPEDIAVEVEPGRRFVGRGAHKLRAALVAFGLPVGGRDCIDVGASTGGFTQVLLEAGAARVIALDVGRGQLDWGLRTDPRVAVVEGVNARHLAAADLPFRPSLAVVDVSFISLALVLRPVVEALDEGRRRDVVALIKPQFEVGRGQVGRGGIVRDPGLHRDVLERMVALASRSGLRVGGLVASPIRGAEGNREFLIHLTPDGSDAGSIDLDRAIESAVGSSLDEDPAP